MRQRSAHESGVPVNFEVLIVTFILSQLGAFSYFRFQSPFHWRTDRKGGFSARVISHKTSVNSAYLSEI